MGLGYMGLAGELEELKSFYGSRDVDAFERLVSSEKRFVRSLLRLDQPGADADERQDALRDIFVGSACTRYKPHQYGYAMEACCFEFAESIGELQAGYGRLFDAGNLLDSVGAAGWLPQMDVVWFIPIPPMDDYPMVQSFTPQECEEYAGKLEAAQVELGPAGLHDIPREFVDGFTKMYRTCAESGRDLIIIAH